MGCYVVIIKNEVDFYMIRKNFKDILSEKLRCRIIILKILEGYINYY